MFEQFMIDKSVPSTALMFGRDPLGFGAPLMDPALPAVLHCYGKRSSGAGLTGSFTLAVAVTTGVFRPSFPFGS